MRFIAFLVFLAGAALTFGYPYVVSNLGGGEIASFRLQDSVGGFQPATAKLAAQDSLVEVLVDATAIRPAGARPGETALTLTASSAGRTVIATALDLADAAAQDDSPQTPQQTYRFVAGSFPVKADADYVFTAGPGDAPDVTLMSVDLTLRRTAGEFDQRALPLGISLLAVGFILLVIGFRRAAAGGPGASNPNSQPPPRRWGRG